LVPIIRLWSTPSCGPDGTHGEDEMAEADDGQPLVQRPGARRGMPGQKQMANG